MSDPTSDPNATIKPQRRRRLTAAAALALSGLAVTTGAIALQAGFANASTQPFSSENPFEADIPSVSNGSGSNIIAGEPFFGDLGDFLPSFPGLPGSTFPSTPGGVRGTIEDVINGGVEGIFGGGSGPVPKIFKDILNGDIGGVLDSILGVLTSQNEIFGEISEIVLGDGWEGIDGDGNKHTPPDPYKVRLPQEKDEEVGLLTHSPIVLRRDKANQYDQELSRAMAAPMLAEEGQKWLETNIKSSAEMMQAGLASTQSAITKAGEATEATSTQEIVRRSAEISGVAATLQMQEMQQNALMGESLWNMQRLESAQLQLAANTSEAADEQNRRDRASRTAGLSSSAYQPLIIPVRSAIEDSPNNAASSASAAPKLFSEP